MNNPIKILDLYGTFRIGILQEWLAFPQSQLRRNRVFVGNGIAFSAKGLGFDSWTRQIRHFVAQFAHAFVIFVSLNNNYPKS